MIAQEDAILYHLRTIGPITPIEALNKYGCFRLGARIWDLRKEGFEIETITIHQNGKHYASYRLAKNEQILEVKLHEIPCGKQSQLSFAQ